MSKDQIVLEVAKRDLTGKKLKKLRQQGIVPAVVYGAETDPVNIQIEIGPLQKAIVEAGTHSLVALRLDSQDTNTLIKSVERDPVSRLPIAVNFQAVSADEIVRTEVPLQITDEDLSPAKKAGLIILQDIENIEIKAKSADLPDAITVSAEKLVEHGDKLLISDLVLPSGVELVQEDQDQVIASVWEPSAIAAQNAAIEEENAKAAEEAADTSAAEGSEEPKEEPAKE